MAINMMCMNSDCKYYYEDNCMRNINEERIEIDSTGKCLSFEKGVSSWYNIDITKEEKVKFLKWRCEMKEWGKIECPFLGNEYVMTYYPKGMPPYDTITAPFIADGDVCYYKYDHDEGGWDESLICIGSIEDYVDCKGEVEFY